MFAIESKEIENTYSHAYPEISNANFMCALCIFKQQLAWNKRVRCGIYIVLL